ERARNRITSVASAAVLVQVVVVYTVNALFKLRGELWMNGDAIRYVFGVDQLTVFVGDFFVQYPVVPEIFSRIWFVLLASSVLLILFTGRLRAVYVSVFVVMHLGMLATLRLGLFPLVSVAALIPFLPSPVWNRLVELEPFSRLHTLCSRWGSRISTVLPSGRILPSSIPWSRISTSLMTVFVIFVITWNAAALGYVDAPSQPIDPRQRTWDMFAPEPRQVDGWYVVPGHLESGREVDAFYDSPVRWERPPDTDATFSSHRWYVYLVDLHVRVPPTCAPISPTTCVGGGTVVTHLRIA
ncbi:MAG: HTTM domain-containing protein, partial [Halobacteria archaeon]|nr:HTTM domain-containing protein [Halobacteria archaeon]